MTAATAKLNTNIRKENPDKYYPWFYANLFLPIEKALNEFFRSEFDVRFMGISLDENILFYGDEYFVNKIAINKSADFKMKISAGVVELLLDSALGASENKFELSRLSDIEAMLIKSFTAHAYKSIESKINKTEINKKLIQDSKELNCTFYVRNAKNHCGKIIISLPDYVFGEIKPEALKETFTINDFRQSSVNITLGVGKSKVTLNEIKAIEDGDIIVLENSDINMMSVIIQDKEVSFRINPDPSLIISIDNNGGNEMEEETGAKPQNMWDSILVDIVAEFDNVKLTLGELKQISEGLVIDVGSVYENKVKLRVENQVVATGELVILNDRYGVRVDSVKKSSQGTKTQQKVQPTVQEQPAPVQQEAVQEEAAAPSENEAENFDYSDFEIEDESI